MAATQGKGTQVPAAPKYIAARKKLLSEIWSGKFKPGDRFYGYSELRHRLGVSVPTVSKAIAGLVDEGWLEAIRGSGIYVLKNNPPESSLTKAKAVHIGMVLPSWQLAYTPGYLHDFVHGVLAEADARDWRLELIRGDPDEAKHYSFGDKIRDRIKDGLIWLQPGEDSLMNLGRLHCQGMPIVCTSRSFPNRLPLPFVREDADQLAALTIETFRKHSHKSFVALLGSKRDSWVKMREASLRREADKAGMEMITSYASDELDNGNLMSSRQPCISQNSQVNAFFIMNSATMFCLEERLSSYGKGINISDLTLVVQNEDRMHLGPQRDNMYEVGWSMEELGRNAALLLGDVMAGKQAEGSEFVSVRIEPYHLDRHGPAVPEMRNKLVPKTERVRAAP